MRAKSLEDVVELLSYLDPRVQYTVSADSAKKLLPFAEEYEMFKLRRSCEIVLQKTFEGIRKEYETGKIPSEITEEYLILSDKYGLQKLLQMCVQEVGKAPTNGLPSRNIIELESLSEQVKLLILEQRLATLSSQLQKERRERNSAEQRLGDTASGTARWRYVGPTQNNYYHQW